MCCQGYLKRIVPFGLTFALGLLVAGIFYGFGSVTGTYSTVSQDGVKKKNCMFEKMHHEVEEEEVFFLEATEPPVAPVAPEAPEAPPAPPAAPEPPPLAPDDIDVTVFPPTPPETVIIKGEKDRAAKR